MWPRGFSKSEFYEDDVQQVFENGDPDSDLKVFINFNSMRIVSQRCLVNEFYENDDPLVFSKSEFYDLWKIKYDLYCIMDDKWLMQTTLDK